MDKGALLGRFRVIAPLGQGGMGRVLRGAHEAGGAPVAVKILTTEGLANPAVRLAFGNEARAVAALNHPGIVQLLDYGVVPEETARASGGLLVAHSPYLVMPLAEGGTVSRWGARLRWAQLRDLLLGLLDALGHAHARGIIHRDIKPGNVLLVDPNDPAAGTWLADFGLVHLHAARHPDAVRLFGGGTPPYMAPEQRGGDLSAQGPWTDLYALGRLASYLAWGAAEDPERRDMRAPKGFEAWVARLTAGDPADRYAFAAHAAEGLAALDVAAPTLSTRWREEPPPSPLLPAMSPAVLSLRKPPMVGRREEREQLWRLVLKARRGPGVHVAVVEGPSGSGRSRLAEWLADQAHERGLAQAVRVSLTDQSGGHDPIAAAVGSLYRVGELSPKKAAARLRRALRGTWSEPALEQLATLLTIAPPVMQMVRVREAPERLALLRRALLEAAQDQPLVITFDDAHYDLDAIQLVESLCASGGRGQAAVVVLMTVSTEALAQRADEQQALDTLMRSVEATALRLAPLSEDEHASLVRGVLGVSRGLVAEVIEKTEGDPRFAVQLVRYWVDAEVLVPTPAGWARRGEGPLPAELQDLYAQRLLQLLADAPRAARRALQLAAVLGLEVDPEEWRAACAVAGLAPAETLVEVLARAGLAQRRGGGGWRFANSLLRACLVEQAVTEGASRGLHLACARALPQAAAERRALHLLQAGRERDAFEPLTEALSQRVAEQRLNRAAQLASLWLDLLDTVEVTENRIARCRGWTALASLHLGRGQLEEALEVSERAGALAEELGETALQVGALRVGALVAWHRGDPEGYLERILHAESVAHGRVRARAQLDLAFGLHMLGRREEAVAWAAKAEALFKRRGDPAGSLDALRFRSNQLSTLQPGEEALALARELRERAEETHSAETLAAGWMNEGEALRHMGQLDEAAVCFQRGAEVFDAAGSAHGVVAWISLGVVRVQQGRCGEARRDLEACLRMLRAHGLHVYEGYVVAWLLRALAELGVWEAVSPAWRGAELSMARVYGAEMLRCLEGAGVAAELALEVDAADVSWSLALEVARRAEDFAALGRARAALSRIDELSSALQHGPATLPPSL